MRGPSRTLAHQLVDRDRTSVAVVDFLDLRQNVTELGRYLAEEMSVALSRAQGLQVVDRAHLSEIIKEHALSAAGLGSKAGELGKIADVQTLVTGTVTLCPDRVHVTIKAIDTTTSVILASTETDVAKTTTIVDLARRDLEPILIRPLGEGSAGALSQQWNGIDITLHRCSRSRKRVTCLVLLASREDRELAVRKGSRAFDGKGNEYGTTGVQLGNQPGPEPKTRLLAGVSMRLTIDFQGVPTRTSKFTDVEVVFEGFSARYQDVPIAR
jgi:TolB-like protein